MRVVFENTDCEQFYPVLNLEGHGIKPFSNIEAIIVQSLKQSFESVQISSYKEYGRYNGKTCVTINIVFVPSLFQFSKEKEFQFDFCAFRFQIRKTKDDIDYSISLSCLSSRAIEENYFQKYDLFDNYILVDIWNLTKNKVRHSTNNHDYLSRWYNYLVSIDLLSYIYPQLMGIFSEIGYYEHLVFDGSHISKLLFDTDVNNVTEKLSSIFANGQTSNLEHYVTQPIHSVPISIHSSTLMNLERMNTISKTRCISTDEFVGSVFCNMKAAYIGDYSYEENSIQDIGETYQSLYHSAYYSKISKNNFDSELIASLWKSIDDTSVKISYQKTQWNNTNYYRLYFGFGIKPTWTIRLSALALAIIDCWQTVTNEDSIEITNLDQLLSLTSLYKSSLCINCCLPLQVEHMDSLTDLACTLVYIGNNSYIAATNYLLRSKVIRFENDKEKRVIIDDNIISAFICSSTTFKQCRNELPILIRYFYHFGDKYNPILNKIFPKDEKTIKYNLHEWTIDAVDYMSMPIVSDRNVAQVNRLSMVIERLLAFSFPPLKDDLQNKAYDSNENIEFIDKITVPSEKVNFDLYLNLFSCMSIWELYCQIFIYKDYSFASMIINKLVETDEEKRYDDIINVWHKYNSIDCFTSADKNILIASISKHLKTLDSNVQ